MKETILVTGGTGFIGSHTTVELQAAGYDVVIVDNLSNSREDVLDGIEKISGIRPAFEKIDLCDFEATENVFKKYPKISGIIHFAASKAVGESVEKPLKYYRNNILSLVNLLELMPKSLRVLSSLLHVQFTVSQTCCLQLRKLQLRRLRAHTEIQNRSTKRSFTIQ